MNKYLLAGAVAALFAFAACAETAAEADLRKIIEASMNKDTKVDSVREAGFLGLYEVIIGGEIVYTDRKGNYLLVGDVVETKTHKNLTDERKQKLSQIRFSDLPLDMAVKQVRGNGKRVFATFEDPNCGFCKKLAKEMQGMTDVTIYTFLYPILTPDSADKSKAIWCAKDQAKAWNDWMVHGTEPVAAKCDTPTDKVVALGRKLNIRGTPTIFFVDGSRVPGFIPAAQLEQSLTKAASGG